MASSSQTQAQLLDSKPEPDNSPSSSNTASGSKSTEFEINESCEHFEASSSSGDIPSTSTAQSSTAEDPQNKTSLKSGTIEEKRKDRRLNAIYPKTVKNKFLNQIFRRKLSEEEKVIFDEVYSLSELSINDLANQETHHIVRPCITLLMNGNLTEQESEYYDLFAIYYIRRLKEEGKAFICKFNKNPPPTLEEKKEMKVFKILGHLGEKEFLLVQFVPRLDDPNDLFEYYTDGEISWTHRDIIGPRNKVYLDYKSGKKTFSIYDL